jgi:peptide/nickel transport system substrate-binding protein
MKKLVLVALLLMMATFVVASAQSSDTVIWSISGDVSTLNPALVTDGNSFTVMDALFDGLFHANPDTGLPEPELATWTISDDGAVYTFTLKEGLKWSDGQPLTSADVKFTYDAIMSDVVESPRKTDMASIASVEVVDDQTFVVTLTSANCTIWGNGFGSLVPLPSHLYAADFSDFMTNENNLAPTAVSGRYLFDSYSAGEFVRLSVNPDYYDGVSNIPNVIYRIVTDPALLNQSLETNTIDYAFMYPDQLAQLPNPENYSTFLYPNANSPIVIMNFQDPANPQNAYDADGNPVELVPNKFFGDIRVRQAIAMGYDKAALALTQGESAGSVPLSGPIVPSFYSAYDMSDIAPWAYDPEKATALLAEAGWTDTNGNGTVDKDGVEFEVDLVYSKLVDLWSNAALIMQDQLSQIGIKINIVEQEWSAYLGNVLLPGKFDLTIVGFGGGTEVDGIAYNLLHSKNVIIGGGGFNLAGYVNPRVDELLDQARTMPGCAVADRLPLYHEMQQIVRDEVAYDWLVSTTQVHVLNSRLNDAYIGQWDSLLPVSFPGWSISG